MIGEVLLLLAAVGALVSGLCIARLDDTLLRMHALSMASTTAMLLALLGAAILLSSANDITTLFLGAALNLLTAPIAANLLSRATYRASGISTRLEGTDEFQAGQVGIERNNDS